jgi:hypothetical protein
MCPNSTSPHAAPCLSRFSSYSSLDSDFKELYESDPCSTSVLASTSEFWLQFQGFNPNPEAPFLKEFDRLAKQQDWSKNEKRRQRVAAFSAEISFHWKNLTVLDSWQALCVEVGAAVGDDVPPSIPKCKKVGGLLVVVFPDSLRVLLVVC